VACRTEFYQPWSGVTELFDAHLALDVGQRVLKPPIASGSRYGVQLTDSAWHHWLGSKGLVLGCQALDSVFQVLGLVLRALQFLLGLVSTSASLRADSSVSALCYVLSGLRGQGGRLQASQSHVPASAQR
jgi:hypothetical protein